MSLLELAHQLSLTPKRTASTNGGEYHSSCPKCGGKDRFIIWEKAGRYLCRQCGSKGDAIQLCRDFMGMDFRAACAKVGVQKEFSYPYRRQWKPKFVPVQVSLPCEEWQTNASLFALDCHERLMKDMPALRLLEERGFTVDSMKAFSLGWNPTDRFLSFPDWGLNAVLNEERKERKLWLPQGLVIPTFCNEKAIKLKIRRRAWKQDDKLPKYVEISGSMKSPSVYGSKDIRVVVLVEAEFDAMLIQQFAADLCCCMAIGGVGKRPDIDSDRLLRKSDIILFALDYDAAGTKAFQFWQGVYPHLKSWPVPKGKSPGDALTMGIDLRKWILSGLARYLGKKVTI